MIITTPTALRLSVATACLLFAGCAAPPEPPPQPAPPEPLADYDGSVVFGRVTEADGSPAAGKNVLFFLEGRMWIQGDVVADDGTFGVRAGPAGTYHLYVYGPFEPSEDKIAEAAVGELMASGAPHAKVTLDLPPDRKRVDIRLSPAERLLPVNLLAPDGRPLEQVLWESEGYPFFSSYQLLWSPDPPATWTEKEPHPLVARYRSLYSWANWPRLAVPRGYTGVIDRPSSGPWWIVVRGARGFVAHHRVEPGDRDARLVVDPAKLQAPAEVVEEVEVIRPDGK